MAPPVSLPDLIGSARTADNRTADKKSRNSMDAYYNNLKLNEKKFADLYFDKLSERQQQALLKTRREHLLARAEPVPRPEPNPADYSRQHEPRHTEAGNRADSRADRSAKNGEKLPGGDDLKGQESLRQDAHRNDSLQQDSLRQDSPGTEKTDHSAAKAADGLPLEDRGESSEENARGEVATEENASIAGSDPNLLVEAPIGAFATENGVTLSDASSAIEDGVISVAGTSSDNALGSQLVAGAEAAPEVAAELDPELANGPIVTGSASPADGDDGANAALAESLPSQAATKTPNLLNSGLADGEAEVTQQFKELNAKLQVTGQQPGITERLNLSLTGHEKPESPRTGQVEATLLDKALLADKALVNAPQTAAVRSSGLMAMPQSAYVTNLQMPVQSADWQKGLAQKLVWFINEKIQSAKIHVNPPELGPVDMKIQVTKDQAQIQIQSPHAIVRDLLEGTAQRLREMMASQGVDLTSFDVGPQQQQTDGGGSHAAEEKHNDGIAGSATEGEQATVVESLELDQLVDYYV